MTSALASSGLLFGPRRSRSLPHSPAAYRRLLSDAGFEMSADDRSQWHMPGSPDKFRLFQRSDGGAIVELPPRGQGHEQFRRLIFSPKNSFRQHLVRLAELGGGDMLVEAFFPQDIYRDKLPPLSDRLDELAPQGNWQISDDNPDHLRPQQEVLSDILVSFAPDYRATSLGEMLQTARGRQILDALHRSRDLFIGLTVKEILDEAARHVPGVLATHP